VSVLFLTMSDANGNPSSFVIITSIDTSSSLPNAGTDKMSENARAADATYILERECIVVTDPPGLATTNPKLKYYVIFIACQLRCRCASSVEGGGLIRNIAHGLRDNGEAIGKGGQCRIMNDLCWDVWRTRCPR
jgi:hypothetical protein